MLAPRYYIQIPIVKLIGISRRKEVVSQNRKTPQKERKYSKTVYIFSNNDETPSFFSF